MNFILDITIAFGSVNATLWRSPLFDGDKPLYVIDWTGTIIDRLLQELIPGTLALDPQAIIKIRPCGCKTCLLKQEQK